MYSQKFSILCIEDNAANMLVVQRIVESQAFHLIQAGTAEEGMEKAIVERPNIILMDMNLPGMDGLEATRIIKQNASLAHVPIIAVTASSVYTKEKCVEAGCADFIPKPVTLSKLLIVLQRYGVGVR
jgi:two-component system, cell cycle response regulator DivK